MSLVKYLGHILWGTPAYEYGSRAYKSAVEAYVRIVPTQGLSVGDATAEFRPSTFMEWNNLRNRIWDEEAVLRDALDNVREDDVFFDVGANIGIYSCLVGNLLTAGTVVPFEPYPPNVERLRANLDANGIAAPVEQRPLADGRRTVPFYVYDTVEPGAQHGSLDTEYPAEEPLGSFSVETIDGDSLVEAGRVPAPTVVKIDVQGTGPAVVDGLRESLAADRCRLVYVEAHDNADRLRDQLASLGFEIDALGVDREGKEPTVVGSTGG
jgi:FkbM family methyltransferase